MYDSFLLKNPCLNCSFCDSEIAAIGEWTSGRIQGLVGVLDHLTDLVGKNEYVRELAEI